MNKFKSFNILDFIVLNYLWNETEAMDYIKIWILYFSFNNLA